MKKKKLLGVLICFIFLLGITGCEKEIKGKPQESKIKILNGGVRFTVKEGTLSNTKATFILKNTSKTKITYGTSYWMEKEENGKWYKIEPKDEMWFTLPEFELNPKESRELEIDWEYGYGKLSPGKYRVVKEVDFEYQSERKKYNIAAEFTIEEDK